MFSFTHLKRKNQKSVQYARPTVPGPIWVPIAGLTSDKIDSTAFNFAEAFSKTDLALASAFACKVASRMLDLPAHFSATNSITRSCALLKVRVRSAEFTTPSVTVRIGFLFIAEHSNHCAPPMRPPLCRNSRVSTAQNTPVFGRTFSASFWQSVRDAPSATTSAWKPSAMAIVSLSKIYICDIITNNIGDYYSTICAWIRQPRAHPNLPGEQSRRVCERNCAHKRFGSVCDPKATPTIRNGRTL